MDCWGGCGAVGTSTPGRWDYKFGTALENDLAMSRNALEQAIHLLGMCPKDTFAHIQGCSLKKFESSKVRNHLNVPWQGNG